MMNALLVALSLVGNVDVPLTTVTSLVHDAFSRCHCLHLLADDSNWAVQILRAMFDTPPCPLMLTPGTKDSAKYLCSDYLFVSYQDNVTMERLRNRRPYTIDRVMVVTHNGTDLYNKTQLFGDAEAIMLVLPTLQMYRLASPVLKNRTFERANRHEKLFPGQSWLRYANLQNRTLVANTFTLLPFSSIENGTKDGIEMKMFQEAERRMNFSWTILEPPQNNRYGEWLPNQTWSGGIAGLLVDGSSEVAFCTLYLVRNKIMHLDMTTPWNQVCITFMVPRPRRLMRLWSAPLSPFEVPLWIGLLMGTLLTTMVLWLVSFSYPVPMTVDHSLIWVMGLLLLGSFPPLGPDRSAVRKLLLCWSYFGLLMVTAYSSKLVAHLSLKRYERPLNTIEDLVRAGMYWGMDYEVPKDDIFDHGDPWAFKLLHRFKMEINQWDRAFRLRKRDYAILGTRVIGKNFYEGIDIERKTLYSLRGMKQCLNKFNIAFALPKLSPLTQPFSHVILRCVESGLTIYWHRDVIRRLSDPALESMSIDKDIDDTEDTLKPFSLDTLGGIFILCIVGHTISSCMFFLEQAWWRYNTLKRPPNKLIKKKSLMDTRKQFGLR